VKHLQPGFATAQCLQVVRLAGLIRRPPEQDQVCSLNETDVIQAEQGIDAGHVYANGMVVHAHAEMDTAPPLRRVANAVAKAVARRMSPPRLPDAAP
jgi:hypothetical protein